MASVAAKSTGGGSQAGRSFAPDRMSDNILRLGRMTPSSMKRVQFERGIDALFASFPKSKQLALRQLCFEYLDVMHRKDIVLKRLAGAGGFAPGSKPELLQKLEEQQLDAEQQLRRMAGSAYGSMLAALNDPEIQEAMAQSNHFTEEQEVEEGGHARVWRRRLENRSWKRVQRGYRRTTHNHPTRLGNKSVWQAINTHDDTTELSYYQKQQLKYGKGRRGSTSIAGAWEQVFNPKKASAPSEGKAGEEEEPSAAAAEAAAAHAAALSGPGHSYVTPAQHAADSAAAPGQAHAAPAAPADPAITALLEQAAHLVSDYAAATGDESVLAPPPPPPDTDALLADAAGLAAPAPPAPTHAAPVYAAPTRPPPGMGGGGDARRASVGARTKGTDSGRSASQSVGGGTQAFTVTGDAANVILPVVRTTPSAAGARAKTTGLTAVMAQHNVRGQHMIREMALDVAELLHRIETIRNRLEEDPLYVPGESDPPEVLSLLQDELREAEERMYERLSPTEASIIISALADRETRQDMGLLPESEEWANAEGEDAARVWRRKLFRMKQQKMARGRYSGMHDTVTTSGDRDLWNTLNTADPDADLSYYQKQQKRYGRGRRGSTAIAGAWAMVFAEEDEKAAAEAAAATAAAMGETPDAGVAPAAASSPSSLDGAAMEELVAQAQTGDMDALLAQMQAMLADAK